MARAAKTAGYDVHVATRVGDCAGKINDEGFTLHPMQWRRGSMNPLRLLSAIYRTHRLYRRVQPDLVHHVALFPIVVGSIAALSTADPHPQCVYRIGIYVHIADCEGASAAFVAGDPSRFAIEACQSRRARGKSRRRRRDREARRAAGTHRRHRGLGRRCRRVHAAARARRSHLHGSLCRPPAQSKGRAELGARARNFSRAWRIRSSTSRRRARPSQSHVDPGASARSVAQDSKFGHARPCRRRSKRVETSAYRRPAVARRRGHPDRA